MDLERLRLKNYEKEFTGREAAVRQEQKKEERVLRRERELMEEKMTLVRELTRLETIREMEDKRLAEQKKAKKAEQNKHQVIRERTEKLLQQRLKNRLEAFLRFPIMRGDVRHTSKPGLAAFNRREDCEEYLGYLQTMPEYAQSYLKELVGVSATTLGKDVSLTIKGNNIVLLLPDEEELKLMEEHAPDAEHFSTAEKATEYLISNASQMGVVRLADATGKEYWVTYIELVKHSHQVKEMEESQNVQSP